MFLRNRTSYAARLSRGRVDDELAIVAVVAVESYARRAAHWEPIENGQAHDTAALEATLWSGASITASGHARGPSRPPYVTPVHLRIGDVSRRLIVFGDRHWEGRGQELVATPARPFEALFVDYSRAFGGRYRAPPGLLPGTDLPHPGGLVEHPTNPEGRGFYPSFEAAEGQPLANVERPESLVKAWSDRPRPAGLGACPAALRLDELPATTEPDLGVWFEGSPPRALRVLHAAPSEQIFPTLTPSTPVLLDGLGESSLAFQIPEPPVRVLSRRTREVEIEGALRCVHVDADAETIAFVWGFAGRYTPALPPRWLEVRPRERARKVA